MYLVCMYGIYIITYIHSWVPSLGSTFKSFYCYLDGKYTLLQIKAAELSQGVNRCPHQCFKDTKMIGQAHSCVLKGTFQGNSQKSVEPTLASQVPIAYSRPVIKGSSTETISSHGKSRG